MTTNRTDTHRPSLLDPAEYRYLGCFYQGDSSDMAMAYRHDEAELNKNIERSGATQFDGNHNLKRTCDHCGAHFAHGAVFLHTPTNEYISVGHICASDTIGLPTKAAAARKRAEKAARAAAEREADKKRYASWREANSDIIEFLAAEQKHPFLRDMQAGLDRWGGLTEGQTNATRKFMARAKEFAARDAERAAAPAPTAAFPTGRQTVTGEILSTKTQHGYYGDEFKMLVKLTDGNKVWGTVPSALEESRYDQATGNYADLKGETVTFTATFAVSKDDEHFGFFKRPTKASVAAAAVSA